MSNVLRLFADHPLVGSWVVANDGSSIQFDIAATGSGFAVAAFDTDDGERYVVDAVRWDGRALCFNLFVPSNGTRLSHRMKVRPGGVIDDAFAGTYLDTLVRK